jgi:hypothetical protein
MFGAVCTVLPCWPPSFLTPALSGVKLSDKDSTYYDISYTDVLKFIVLEIRILPPEV